MSWTDQFNRMGHPGKLIGVVEVSGGTDTAFTGSNYGAHAVMTQGSYDGTVHLTNGSAISGSHLTNGVVYELSVGLVSGGTTGTIYVFKR
jgi:hypothetical protein